MADPKDPKPPSRRTAHPPTPGERAKAEERITAAKKEQQRIDDALEAIEKQRTKLTKEREGMENTLTANLQDRHKAYLEIYDTQTQELLQAEERYTLQQKVLSEEESILDTLEKELKAAERQQGFDSAKLANLKTQLATQQDLVKTEEKRTKELKAQTEEGKKLEKYLDGIKADSQWWAQNLFGITESSRKIGKYFLDAHGNTKLLNGSVKLLGQHLAKSVDKAGVIGSTLEKAYEAFGSLKKQAMDWSKSLVTGPWEATQKFATDTRLQAQELGYDMEQMNSQLIERSHAVTKGLIMTDAEAQKTYATLIQGSTQFKRVSDEESAAFQRSSMMLTRLGVDAKTSGQIWDSLQTTYGKTATEATRLTAQTTELARKLKLDVNQVAVELAGSMDKLAIYAVPNVIEEFGKLKAMQMTTGASMDTLMSSMEQWSTFEGAATSAQTLNAVFSDLNISGVEMMRIQNTEGAGAAMMFLKQRLDEAGVTVDQFNNGPMRKLAGDLFGGGDAAAGMKILEASTADMQKAIDDAGGSTANNLDIQKKLADQTNKQATNEQKAANRIDKTRQELQKFGDTWYEIKGAIDNWLAASPWVGIVGGMVTMTGGAIGSLVMMWSTWAIKAIASANAVRVATQNAAMVPGGPMGGGGGRFAGGPGGGKRYMPPGTMLPGMGKSPGGFGKFKSFMKGGGGRMGMGIAGMGIGALTPEEVGYGNVAGTTGEYAAYGASMGGAPGAIVGGGIGLAKSLIDWRLESDDPTWGVGGGGESMETFDVPQFHDGGTISEDARMVSKASGKPIADVEGGEKVVPKGASTAPARVTINLVLQDGTLIKSTQAAVDLLAPEIFAQMKI